MLGRDSIICRDGYSWSQAHYTVLQNSTLVTPYVDEHKNSLRSKHPEQCDDWITCEHIRTFSSWLETRLRGDKTVCDELYLLSRGPSSTVTIWKGYEINGNTFYTIDQDQKSTNQNSGVRFDATTKTGKETYYGYIEDIWELDYGRGLKVPFVSVQMGQYDTRRDNGRPAVRNDNSGSQQSCVCTRTFRPSQ